MFSKLVGIVAVIFFAASDVSANNSLLKTKSILDITLAETELSHLSTAYGIELEKVSFHPTTVGCISFVKAETTVSIGFINSFFNKKRIGRYSVFEGKKNENCKKVSTISMPETYLGLNETQLIKKFGESYLTGIHETSLSDKEGLSGKKYIEYEITFPNKEKLVIVNNTKKTILIESSLMATFTFDDNGIVFSYLIALFEEPTE